MPPDEMYTALDLIVMSAGAAALVAVALAGCLRPTALLEAPPRRAGLRGRDLLLAFGLLFVASSLAGVVLTGFGLTPPAADTVPLPGDPEVTTPPADAPQALGELTSAQQAAQALLSQVLVYGVVVLFVIVRVLDTPGGMREFGFLPQARWRECLAALLGLLVGLPLAMGLNTAVTIVSKALGAEVPGIGHELLGVMRNSSSIWATVALIFSAVAVAPLLEEILFRGLIQSVLLELLGREHRWLVVLCAALPFAAIHVNNVPWQALPGLFGLGIVLGWLYERHGSLLPCVLVHAGFNACNVALLFAFTKASPDL